MEQAVENFISLEKPLSTLKFINNVNITECLVIAKEINNLLNNNNEILSEIEEKKTEKIVLLKEMLSKFDWINSEKCLEGKNKKEEANLKNIFLQIYQLLTELDKEICNKVERPGKISRF